MKIYIEEKSKKTVPLTSTYQGAIIYLIVKFSVFSLKKRNSSYRINIKYIWCVTNQLMNIWWRIFCSWVYDLFSLACNFSTTEHSGIRWEQYAAAN